MDTTDNLGFQIQQVATSLARQTDRILMHDLGIGYSQFKILVALEAEEGVQQKQLAERLDQTEASVSRQVKGLQAAKLLTARVNPENRRERITVLTSRGVSMTEEARQLLNDYYAPMFAQISAHEQQQLREILFKVHDFIKR